MSGSARPLAVDLSRRGWVETDPERIALLEAEVESLPPREEDCPTCGGGRWLRVGPMLAGTGTRLADALPPPVRRVIPCPDCNAPKPTDLLAASGIPEMYAAMTFDTFPAVEGKTEALSALKTWVKHPKNLLIFGENGRGKSGLAVSSTRWLCEHGVGAKFVQVVTLLAQVRAGFDDGSAERLMDSYRSVPVLVLDDIGRARPTPWVAEQLPALIEERRVTNRPTVITTDVGSDWLLSAYGPALVSRLREYQRVKVGGAELRRPA